MIKIVRRDVHNVGINLNHISDFDSSFFLGFIVFQSVFILLFVKTKRWMILNKYQKYLQKINIYYTFVARYQ